jgi:hypothetical protein
VHEQLLPFTSATLPNSPTVIVCPGQAQIVESCNSSPSESYCVGDTVFRLVNTLTGAQSTANDDGCGATASCSALTY